MFEEHRYLMNIRWKWIFDGNANGWNYSPRALHLAQATKYQECIFCANSTTFRGWWIFNLHLSSSQAGILRYTSLFSEQLLIVQVKDLMHLLWHITIILQLRLSAWVGHLQQTVQTWTLSELTVHTTQSPEYLESNPVDVVLDEEEELLGDAKDPGWLVPWEEPAVSLVPAIALHLHLSFGNYLIVYFQTVWGSHNFHNHNLTV